MWCNVSRPISKVAVIEILNNRLENTLKKEINNKMLTTVFQFLLQYLKNNKLSHGAKSAAAIKFNVHHNTR